MEVERYVERLHTLPERIVSRVVEINAVGVAVDHRTDETEFTHATLQLVGSSSRVLHGEMCKARVAARPVLHLPRQQVVGLACALHRERRIPLNLNTWTRQRQNCQPDARRVHRAEALVSEIRKAVDQLIM